MTMVLCPFCLERFDYEDRGPAAQRRPTEAANGQAGQQEESRSVHCEQCGEPVPWLYLRSGLDCPSDVVVTVGRRGFGKTTMLTALLGTLIEAPNQLHHGLVVGTYTPDAGPRATSDYGPIAWVRGAYNQFMRHGALPAGTPLVGQPLPFYLRRLPPVGKRRYTQRNLFLFDAGGEAFDNVTSFANGARWAVYSRVLWMVASLDEDGTRERDAAEQYGGIAGSLWDLLNVYIGVRERVLREHPSWSSAPQALLIIFTKADAHNGRMPVLDRYLRQEAYSTREERTGLSQLLRQWMLENQRTQAALNSADENFARVEFCAVSATGARVASGQSSLDLRPRPCRIFDPLLWTWELTDELNRRGLGPFFRWGRR